MLPASMRRTPFPRALSLSTGLALVAAAALAAGGCSTSPCQDLGEKLCTCTGESKDTCKTQIEEQLKKLDPTKDQLDKCDQLLGSCHEPEGANFCEWLRTSGAKVACGVAPPQ
jgi:hypothetical protein